MFWFSLRGDPHHLGECCACLSSHLLLNPIPPQSAGLHASELLLFTFALESEAVSHDVDIRYFRAMIPSYALTANNQRSVFTHKLDALGVQHDGIVDDRFVSPYWDIEVVLEFSYVVLTLAPSVINILGVEKFSMMYVAGAIVSSLVGSAWQLKRGVCVPSLVRYIQDEGERSKSLTILLGC